MGASEKRAASFHGDTAALIAEARQAADEVDAIMPGGIRTVEGAVIRRIADALEFEVARSERLSVEVGQAWTDRDAALWRLGTVQADVWDEALFEIDRTWGERFSELTTNPYREANTDD